MISLLHPNRPDALAARCCVRERLPVFYHYAPNKDPQESLGFSQGCLSCGYSDRESSIPTCFTEYRSLLSLVPRSQGIMASPAHLDRCNDILDILKLKTLSMYLTICLVFFYRFLVHVFFCSSEKNVVAPLLQKMWYTFFLKVCC